MFIDIATWHAFAIKLVILQLILCIVGQQKKQIYGLFYKQTIQDFHVVTNSLGQASFSLRPE